MKTIPLTPYSGYVVVTRTIEEHARQFKKMFGHDCPEAVIRGGLATHHATEPIFLVYARDVASLVHELGHVVLDTFVFIRSDPTEGNGEPFAYLLGHLFAEATKKTKPRHM